MATLKQSVATFLEAVTVVVRGNFNPSIFSPAWLLYQGLIGNDEFENETVEGINSAVASFSTGWLTCLITRDRMQFVTAEPEEFERVRDLAVGVLQALPHTPVAALGINRETHFQVSDVEVWHSIGDRLAPKEFWTSLNLPGMRSISIEGSRKDLYAGQVIVQTEPSVQVRNGIYVAHNDHYDLKKLRSALMSRNDFGVPNEAATLADASETKLAMAVEVLNDRWEDSMHRATHNFDNIKKMAGTK